MINRAPIVGLQLPSIKESSVLILDLEDATLDLNQELLIDIDNITQSYIDQPSKYAWWATLASRARAKVDDLKLRVEIQEDFLKKTLKGELDAKFRKQLELEGEKITEGKVENRIYSSEEYNAEKEKLFEIRAHLLKATEDAVALEIARDSFNQRKDMLISLGAQLRSDFENNSDLSINKKQVSDMYRNKRKKEVD